MSLVYGFMDIFIAAGNFSTPVYGAAVNAQQLGYLRQYEESLS